VRQILLLQIMDTNTPTRGTFRHITTDMLLDLGGKQRQKLARPGLSADQCICNQLDEKRARKGATTLLEIYG
jgi:hypothetical protein